MRLLSGRAAASAVERIAARGARPSAQESRVRRIVQDVRRGGDRSLRRYAERWDGLGRASLCAYNAGWGPRAHDAQLRKSAPGD
jgi:histidinol dehydrogenase